MPTKEIIFEFKKILNQRGELTREQREYSRVEEQVMDELYPLTKPNEEKRYSNLRTLDRYIGEEAFDEIKDEKGELVLAYK